MEKSKNRPNNMNEIENLKKEATQLAFNSVYMSDTNKYFRDILLKKIISLETESRRDEKITQILEEDNEKRVD